MVKPDMSVRIGPLALKNPVMAASGTFGYGLEFQPYFDISVLGGFVTKGLSPRPRVGNPPPRAKVRREFDPSGKGGGTIHACTFGEGADEFRCQRGAS